MPSGDWPSESGYRIGLALADEPGCTAVFAANDQIALGLLRALHEKGRGVPRDISVVGFDDIPDCVSHIPPLTTIHQDFTEVGRRRVDHVLRQVRNDPVTPGTSPRPHPAGRARHHGGAAGLMGKGTAVVVNSDETGCVYRIGCGCPMGWLIQAASGSRGGRGRCAKRCGYRVWARSRVVCRWSRI